MRRDFPPLLPPRSRPCVCPPPARGRSRRRPPRCGGSGIPTLFSSLCARCRRQPRSTACPPASVAGPATLQTQLPVCHGAPWARACGETLGGAGAEDRVRHEFSTATRDGRQLPVAQLIEAGAAWSVPHSSLMLHRHTTGGTAPLTHTSRRRAQPRAWHAATSSEACCRPPALNSPSAPPRILVCTPACLPSRQCMLLGLARAHLALWAPSARRPAQALPWWATRPDRRTRESLACRGCADRPAKQREFAAATSPPASFPPLAAARSSSFLQPPSPCTCPPRPPPAWRRAR